MGALNENVLTIYAGQREAQQWQSIPPAAQASPRHSEGVISLGHDFRVSALRRDKSNQMRSSDLCLQVKYEIQPDPFANLGLRRGWLRVSSDDHDLSNGDDSGALSHGYNTPVAGPQWLASPNLNLYAGAGNGFESPTQGELAYRPDGATGFNAELQPRTIPRIEVGAKWRDVEKGLALEATLFRADTEDEFSVLSNAGGRCTQQNVGRARRSGAELGVRRQPNPAWRAAVALTYREATYLDSFQTCAAVPCTRAADRVTGPRRQPHCGHHAQERLCRSRLAGAG